MSWVGDDFAVPVTSDGPGFRLEPLAPVHNERDYEAWTSSMNHIRATPGMGGRRWPHPMTLDENLADMEMHWQEFVDREAFTYSILEGDEVIGCVYIYPSDDPGVDAQVRSWVRESHAQLDRPIWSWLSDWLDESWPFHAVSYAPR